MNSWQARVTHLGWTVIEEVAPFLAEYVGSRRIAIVSDVDSLARQNLGLLDQEPSAIDFLPDIENAEQARGSSLDGKAVAVLTVVSVIAGVLAAIQILVWQYLGWRQHLLLVLADTYGLIAFLEILHAVRVGVDYIFTQADIERCRSNPLRPNTALKTQAAALRFAFIAANLPRRLILSNRIESAFVSARNAVLLATLGFITAAVHPA